MKKCFICLILLLIFVEGVFTNERFNSNCNTMIYKSINNHKMDNTVLYNQSMDSETKVRYAGVAQIAIGSTLLTLGISGWGGIIAGEAFTKGQLIFSAYGFAFMLPMIAHAVTLIGSMLIYTGCSFLRCCEQYFYGSTEWKYEMHKMRRNLGIILLGTSVVPLSGLISSIALMCIPNFDSVLFILPLIGSILFSLGHIISGSCILAGYARKLKKYWSCLMPDLAITHDDKKSYTEGYGVSVGMRVRI